MNKIDLNKCKVVGKQVLIKPVEKGMKERASGLVIPGVTKNAKYGMAKVIKIGYEVENIFIENKVEPLKIGDLVYYMISAATDIEIDTEEKENDLFCIGDVERMIHIIV